MSRIAPAAVSALLILVAPMSPMPTQAEAADFTFKRIKPGKPKGGKFITIQVEPKAAAKRVLPPHAGASAGER